MMRRMYGLPFFFTKKQAQHRVNDALPAISELFNYNL